MAIQQIKKQSDLEKRLRLLRQQMYGKSPDHSPHFAPSASHLAGEAGRPTDTPNHSSSVRTDTAYLRQDILKITILATSAIGIQLILFVLSRNHILNLNFF
jgi:hypothetical protein